VLPGGLSTGGEIVSQRFIEGLSRSGCTVTCLGYARIGYTPRPGEVVAETRSIETATAGSAAAMWAAKALLGGRPYSMQKYIGSSYYDQLTSLIREKNFGLTVIDHAQMGWLRSGLRNSYVIHICHNNETALYTARVASASGIRRAMLRREAERIRHVESDLAEYCNAIWTLTQSDRAHFLSLGAPNVMAFSVPGIRSQDPVSLKPKYDVALLGSWTWQPNRVGLNWFIERVLPLLPPTLTIQVAGAGADDLRGRRPNVQVNGRIPDAWRFLSEAKCVAVPSIEGAGLQVKTLDAISTGRPVVATTFAVREIDPPSTVFVADEPQAFASALMHATSGASPGLDDSWARNREGRFFSDVDLAVSNLLNHLGVDV